MAVFGIAVFLALFGTAKGGRGKNLSLAGAYRETQKGGGVERPLPPAQYVYGL